MFAGLATKQVTSLLSALLGHILLTRWHFRPPSGPMETSASHTTVVYSVPTHVPGRIGAPSVMGSTQGLRVINRQGENKKINNAELPRGPTTPVNVGRMGDLLHSHPDKELVRFVIEGLRKGFDLGFVGDFQDQNSRPKNLLSARQVPALVQQAIDKELIRGHTGGPFDDPPFPFTHCSPLGAAEKSDGSVRLILDLSSPRGDSVNDGIS